MNSAIPAFVIRDKGMVMLILFGFSPNPKIWLIYHLIGVREKYQRMGLGKLLYDNFIEIANRITFKKSRQ